MNKTFVAIAVVLFGIFITNQAAPSLNVQAANPSVNGSTHNTTNQTQVRNVSLVYLNQTTGLNRTYQLTLELLSKAGSNFTNVNFSLPTQNVTVFRGNYGDIVNFTKGMNTGDLYVARMGNLSMNVTIFAPNTFNQSQTLILGD